MSGPTAFLIGAVMAQAFPGVGGLRERGGIPGHVLRHLAALLGLSYPLDNRSQDRPPVQDNFSDKRGAASEVYWLMPSNPSLFIFMTNTSLSLICVAVS